MRAPDVWEEPNLIARVLAPAGWVYSAAGAIRERLIEPYDPGVPIVCVGNAVVGGAGKTPLTFTLAKLLSAQNPHALSRGYGGSLREAVRVDPAIHTHREVGDEPLLLAEAMPVWTSKTAATGPKPRLKAVPDCWLWTMGCRTLPCESRCLCLLSIATSAQATAFASRRGRCVSPCGEQLDDAMRLY